MSTFEEIWCKHQNFVISVDTKTIADTNTGLLKIGDFRKFE